MFVSKSITIVLAALTTSAFAICHIGTSIDMNCCWGGTAGEDACFRQQKSINCGNGIEQANFCKNIGIDRTRCDADCCDPRTGWGKACPKGKNACNGICPN
ncbi:hypothetical protein ColTof4_03216 [Colletotrichum tofieldiae]|uniref:Uncharacterized protein n=1 Tax=Colletotrichum liriopes TaxID=708192 RepID=A0AA37GIN9_9PEZI|nr:hypothetical protein ColLi_04262 [Colletotrichum liriopes]GKT66031.1 hypothetical protein ColTof3_13370 [Colletotrichum tofieldiae]GKT70793.1 hypothetical protein ColTof4_03216 [Colletotrichum tofieldiae]GKT94310.1 hypothetical protein Ct61P_12160 [Colletotrichum tofieldiae]